MVLQKKRVVFWLKVVVIIYCLVGIALYYLQDFFLFHPEPLPPDHKFKTDIVYKEIFIPINKTDSIHILQLLPDQLPPKGLVLYYHGNMKNAEYYLEYIDLFTNKGYEVWIPDYPGFGKTTGELSEKKLYDHAWQVQHLAKTKYAVSDILIYGKSLGTGIAAYTASVLEGRLLILETPYYSVSQLFSFYAFMYPTSVMGNYKIPTWEFLQDVKMPVRIFHGTSDNIIPYSSAERLKPFLKPGDRFITIQDAEHNDIGTKSEYRVVMDSILR